MGHAWKLRDIERLCPFQAALGEHLQLRFNTVRLIQAADCDEDHAGEALQIAAVNPCAADRTEVAVQLFAGLGDVVEWFRELKSPVGTPKKAITPPDDFWQSLQ
jgi:hypothetical protein